jgi:hypothetical protein
MIRGDLAAVGDTKDTKFLELNGASVSAFMRDVKEGKYPTPGSIA